jgi:hypothetical protein
MKPTLQKGHRKIKLGLLPGGNFNYSMSDAGIQVINRLRSTPVTRLEHPGNHAVFLIGSVIIIGGFYAEHGDYFKASLSLKNILNTHSGIPGPG